MLHDFSTIATTFCIARYRDVGRVGWCLLPLIVATPIIGPGLRLTGVLLQFSEASSHDTVSHNSYAEIYSKPSWARDISRVSLCSEQVWHDFGHTIASTGARDLVAPGCKLWRCAIVVLKTFDVPPRTFKSLNALPQPLLSV